MKLSTLVATFIDNSSVKFQPQAFSSQRRFGNLLKHSLQPYGCKSKANGCFCESNRFKKTVEVINCYGSVLEFIKQQ